MEDNPEENLDVGGTFYFTIKAGRAAGDGTFKIVYDDSGDDRGTCWGYSIPIHVV